MRRQWIALVIASALAVSVSGADHPSRVTVGLRANPAKIVPGVPVTLQVEIGNPTSEAVTFADAVALSVESSNGNFIAMNGDGSAYGTKAYWPEGTELPLRLDPGETRSLTYAVSTDLLSPLWFWDPRLNHPGEYKLRLLYDLADPGANSLSSAEDVADGLRWSKSRRSAAATLTIVEPEGEDAVVWARMQKLAEGRWNVFFYGSSGFGLANFVWREHPSSQYLHQLATMLALTDREEAIRAVRAAIAMDPDSVRVPSLKFVLSGQYRRLATERAQVHGEIDETSVNIARMLLREVLASRDESLRESAEAVLATLPDRSELVGIAHSAHSEH